MKRLKRTATRIEGARRHHLLPRRRVVCILSTGEAGSPLLKAL